MTVKKLLQALCRYCLWQKRKSKKNGVITKSGDDPMNGFA
jgi:hypothetical protein